MTKSSKLVTGWVLALALVTGSATPARALIDGDGCTTTQTVTITSVSNPDGTTTTTTTTTIVTKCVSTTAPAESVS
jgi:hypothetical protein